VQLKISFIEILISISLKKGRKAVNKTNKDSVRKKTIIKNSYNLKKSN